MTMKDFFEGERHTAEGLSYNDIRGLAQVGMNIGDLV